MIPQQQILQQHYSIYIIHVDNVIVLSDLVESSGCSSETLQRGSCPCAPLDEALRYVNLCTCSTPERVDRESCDTQVKGH